MALNAGNLEMTPVLCSTGQKADQTICELLFFAEHRGHRHSHDGLDPTDSKVALLRSHDKIGFVFAKKRPVLTASALAASEVERRVRHRSRR